ncbi:MAG: hypothetical protein V1918_01420 [Planctomycetota bacterium]
MKTKWCGFLVIVGIFFAGWALPAEPTTPLESYLPEGTLFVAGIPDMNGLILKMGNTPASRIMRDEAVRAFLEKPLEEIDTFLRGLKNEHLASAELKEALTLASLAEIFSGGLVIAMEAPQGPTFQSSDEISFLVLADIGDQQARLDSLLQLLIREGAEYLETKTRDYMGSTITGIFPKDVDESEPALLKNPVNFAFAKQYVIFANKLGGARRGIKTVLDGVEPNLLHSAKYTRMRALAGEAPDILYYADFESFLNAMPNPAAPVPGAEEAFPTDAGGKPDLRQIYATLGIDNLKTAALWGKVADDGSVRQGGFIECPVEKKGLLKLLSQSAAPLSLPGYLPSSAMLYETVRVSPTQIQAFAKEVADLFAPGMSEKMDTGLAELKETKGIDLQAGLIDALGDQVEFMLIRPQGGQATPVMPGPMAMASMQVEYFRMMLFSCSVKDSANLGLFVRTIMDKIAEEFSKNMPKMPNMPGADSMFAPQKEEVNGFTIYSLPDFGMGFMPIPLPVFALSKDRLFVALNMDVVKQVVSLHGNETSEMAKNPQCQAALAQLSGEAATVFLCMDNGNYMAWYWDWIKEAFPLLLKELQRIQPLVTEMQQNPLDSSTPSAEEAEEGGNAPLFERVASMIDMNLWPDGAIFKKYLGFSAGKILPVEDGFRVEGVQIPAPPPEPAAAPAQ